MRFQTYLYLASALLITKMHSVNGTFVDTTLAPGGASGSVVEYIVHSSMLGTVGLYHRKNIIRPRTSGSIGVANILSLPHIAFEESMSEEGIRAVITRSFALVRGCLMRQSSLTTVLISGTGTFDAMVNGAPESIRDTVRNVLHQVIRETFNDLEGKSIMVDDMSAFEMPAPATTGVTYVRTRAIIGPEPLRRMGATTLIVTVHGDALSGQLTPFIEGGLVEPRDAAIVHIDDSASTVVASADLPVLPEVVAETATSTVAPPGLSEEDQAEISRLFAADFDAIADAAAAAAAVEPSSPEVRPPIPPQVVRLVDDDLPPFDPSTEADPETRAAMIASLAPFPAAIPASTEDRLLAGVIESDDVDQLWEVSGHDASMFAVILFEKGYEPETVDLLLAAYN